MTKEKLNQLGKTCECLTPIDALTIPQTKKFDALKSHKKGLMQQLSPVID